ncbi:hypothetical protein, conserved [Babesia bigemina]|uniref:Uncharacterized protein n=1 Tax=Babesia bigemina TaxID=5866 RepID=A0A061D301_BABBI|nr:hypothetical protein, conserved [Babesia bigemina]CDR95146.1 hypothetical protein, conserved [Babesia bigemina]|eukprot:XP_012767332.1 hypothetical protein, conserved [Babesia bigemina]
MSYIPSQAAHSVVQRIIDDIKKNAVEIAGRHARAKLRSSYVERSPGARATAVTPRLQQTAARRQCPVPGRSTHVSAGDYFTRLVNSSPKPRVLRSAAHPVAIHLLKLAHSAAYRKYRKLVLLSSPKLIREYCERHGACSRLYTTSFDNPLLMEPQIRGNKVLTCSEKLLRKIASVHSYNNGLLAEVPYPPPSQHLGNATLVLCVGASARAAERDTAATLMRTAHALQWQAVWLLQHGEHDFLDPRAIRASQNCLDTMPYITGDAREAVNFAKENGLLMCVCADGGIAIGSENAQQILKRHRGMMLLVGKQPRELIESATKLDVMLSNPRGHVVASECAAPRQYALDGSTKSCILMYLVRKQLHFTAPRSPYLA